jgi:hypothetical protein
MRKVLKDTKSLLLENMAKLNPDFQLKEEDKKWIQKAVNPEHKGYCTPMTKPTCTPARKALAKRFKKGIDEETDKGREIIYTFKTDAITETMGDPNKKQYRHPVHLIEGTMKYTPTYNGVVLSISDTPGSWYVDTLMEGDAKYNNIMYIDFGAKWICSNWSEIMKELNEWISNSENIQEGIGVQSFTDPKEFKAKAEKIKAVVDKLFNEEDFDIIETLYRMMVERRKGSPTIVKNSGGITEDHSLDYQKKADLIKGKVDFLFDNNHYDVLDKIDKIMDQLFQSGEEETELAETKK